MLFENLENLTKSKNIFEDILEANKKFQLEIFILRVGTTKSKYHIKNIYKLFVK